MTYDPAFMNTASCKSAITFIDGDKGILRYRGYPIEQLAEKATFLEVAWLLRNGELPDADRVRRVGARHHVPHVRAREHQDVPAGLPLRRAPDVDAVQRGRGAVVVLSGGEEHPRSRRARTSRSCACSPSCRRSPRSAIRHVQGAAVHLSRQRPRLRRELPLDGRADVGAEVRGESGVREGARGAVHPPRRPRAELLDERRARRRLARTSIRSRRSRPASPRSTARCTAARTSRCCA